VGGRRVLHGEALCLRHAQKRKESDRGYFIGERKGKNGGERRVAPSCARQNGGTQKGVSSKGVDQIKGKKGGGEDKALDVEVATSFLFKKRS